MVESAISTGNEIGKTVLNKSHAVDVARKFYEVKSLLPENNFAGFITNYLPGIYRNWDSSVSKDLCNMFDSFDLLIKNRIVKSRLYYQELKHSRIKIITDGLNPPWRLVLRIPGIDYVEQRSISEQCRTHNVDVSNWYIPTHWMMAEKPKVNHKLPGTEKLSREIFQLWLDENTSIDDIKYISKVFIRSMENVILRRDTQVK